VNPGKLAFILAMAAGFLAGKANADVKIRQMIERQNEHIATLNARALVREIRTADYNDGYDGFTDGD
jgi:hypothetical protein